MELINLELKNISFPNIIEFGLESHSLKIQIWNPNFQIKKQKIKEIYTLDNSKYMLDHFTSVGLEEEGTNWRFEALLLEENKGGSVDWFFRV